MEQGPRPAGDICQCIVRGSTLLRGSCRQHHYARWHKGEAPSDTIELERNGATLVASIEDTGCEFDPTQFPPLSMARSLDDAKVRDYGIHLVRSFASGMHYERREGRNRLTLRFGGPH
jgi:anti-sigma regulatory factor (Ser/Thr protein kinase)